MEKSAFGGVAGIDSGVSGLAPGAAHPPWTRASGISAMGRHMVGAEGVTRRMVR